MKADKPRKNAHPALRIFGISRDIICILAALVILATVCCFLFGYKPAIVLSGSMEPTIETGSIVLIDTNDKDIAKGDIIAFTVDNTFITHRVVKIDDEGIHTKGDGNETEDLWVLEDSSITGKTVFWIPKAGYIAGWLTSRQGMIIVIGICAALIIASFLDFTPKDEKEKKRKKKAPASSTNETEKKQPAAEPSTNETGRAGEAEAASPTIETSDSVSHVEGETGFWEATETTSAPELGMVSEKDMKNIEAARAAREMFTSETAAKEPVSHVEKKAGEEEKPHESEKTDGTVSHVDSAPGKSAAGETGTEEKSPESDCRLRRNADGRLYIGDIYIPETKEEFEKLEKSRQAEVMHLLRAIRDQGKKAEY